MAAKDRLNGMPFTCSNRRFHTDTSRGKPHGVGQAAGSVFDTALVPTTPYSLWLEYVVDRNGGWDPFWLMWYDANGNPTMPMSGAFDRAQLQEMTARLMAFIDIK